jgi:hypothetical protein
VSSFSRLADDAALVEAELEHNGGSPVLETGAGADADIAAGFNGVFEIAPQPGSTLVETAEPQLAELDSEMHERTLRVARFNHSQLSKKLASDSAPVFVVDATAVLERIPHYDRYHLALDEPAARDEMVRDFSFLAGQQNGEFYLVFNDPHEAKVPIHEAVHLEYGDPATGDPNPGDKRIQEIVLDHLEHERNVALVTSDPALMGLFKGENVEVFSLGEFFLT